MISINIQEFGRHSIAVSPNDESGDTGRPRARFVYPSANSLLPAREKPGFVNSRIFTSKPLTNIYREQLTPLSIV
jgi:hypothetical protein